MAQKACIAARSFIYKTQPRITVLWHAWRIVKSLNQKHISLVNKCLFQYLSFEISLNLLWNVYTYICPLFVSFFYMFEQLHSTGIEKLFLNKFRAKSLKKERAIKKHLVKNITTSISQLIDRVWNFRFLDRYYGVEVSVKCYWNCFNLFLFSYNYKGGSASSHSVTDRSIIKYPWVRNVWPALSLLITVSSFLHLLFSYHEQVYELILLIQSTSSFFSVFHFSFMSSLI